MKKYIYTGCVAVAALVIALPAFAETAETTIKQGYHTETTLLGYEESTIGKVTINDEIYTGSGQLPAEAFMVLDNNGDGALSKNEMFAFSNKNKGPSANFKTKDGRQGQSDYNVRGGNGVKVEDFTPDGTLFESMDSNGDGFVTNAEFRLDIRPNAKIIGTAPESKAIMAPAAGMPPSSTNE